MKIEIEQFWILGSTDGGVIRRFKQVIDTEDISCFSAGHYSKDDADFDYIYATMKLWDADGNHKIKIIGNYDDFKKVMSIDFMFPKDLPASEKVNNKIDDQLVKLVQDSIDAMEVAKYKLYKCGLHSGTASIGLLNDQGFKNHSYLKSIGKNHIPLTETESKLKGKDPDEQTTT